MTDTMLRAFLDEARELLRRAKDDVARLLVSYDVSLAEEVFRSAHTVKSSARAVGLYELGALLHQMETVCEGIIAHGALPEVLQRLSRTFTALLEVLEEGKMTEKETVLRITDLWEGKIVSLQSSLTIPGDLHLSSFLYEKLMASAESVLSAKTKVEALGDVLVRATARLGGAREVATSTEYESATQVLHRATVDLESSLRDARMTPLSVFFDRLPFLVEDLGGTLQKHVELSVSGGELQADRTIIRELGGALGHLVRNAIDHGIGKEGKISVGARQEHDHLFVSVENDGQGIDFVRIADVARARGVIVGDTPLSAEAQKELLFHPHISTKEAVTEFSGRGVGMSAVKEYVRSVGGTVTVDSPSSGGGGTRVTLRIPTSLSLVRVLLFRAGHATFGVPLSDLRGSSLFDEKAVKEEQGKQVIAVGERLLPFLPLSEMLRLDGGYQRQGKPLVLSLAGGEKGEIAVRVDAVLHEEDVLVRVLPRILAPHKAFRGAAMIGDSRTILILDGEGLSHMPMLAYRPPGAEARTLSLMDRDQLMEVMNMVASHAGTALSRRLGSHIELSVPECADGKEELPEEDWGASSIGVRMNLEGEYPGHLLFEIPAPLCAKITGMVQKNRADLHRLSEEERAFFQEFGQIAMHAVGNMLSKISKHPVMTTMSDVRVDARGALRTYFLTGHQGSPEDRVRVRLWFGVGEGIRTDDHRETGSLTMEFLREDARKLLEASVALA